MVVLARGQDAEVLVMVVDSFLPHHEVERMGVVDVELVTYGIRHREGDAVRRKPLGGSLFLVRDEVREGLAVACGVGVVDSEL